MDSIVFYRLILNRYLQPERIQQHHNNWKHDVIFQKPLGYIMHLKKRRIINEKQVSKNDKDKLHLIKKNHDKLQQFRLWKEGYQKEESTVQKETKGRKKKTNPGMIYRSKRRRWRRFGIKPKREANERKRKRRKKKKEERHATDVCEYIVRVRARTHEEQGRLSRLLVVCRPLLAHM